MENIFLQVRNKDIRKFNPLLSFGKSASLYCYKPFWNYLTKFINADECKHGNFDLWVSVSDLSTKDVKRFNMRNLPSGLDPVKVLVSSASIPVLVPPVDGCWVDGGVADDFGLLAALEAGATEIILLFPNRSDNWSHPKNLIDAAVNSISMLQYANYQRQKDALKFFSTGKYECFDTGKRSLRINSLKQEATKVQLTEIEIYRDDIPVWDFDFDPEARAELILQGAEAASALGH